MGIFDFLNNIKKIIDKRIEEGRLYKEYCPYNKEAKVLWKKYYKKNGQYHGRYLEYIANKDDNWITAEINYKNGIKDGFTRYYYKNKLSTESIFKEGNAIFSKMICPWSGNHKIADINKGFYKEIITTEGEKDKILEISEIVGIVVNEGGIFPEGKRGGIYPIKSGLSEKFFENGKMKEKGYWGKNNSSSIYDLSHRKGEHIFFHENGNEFKKGAWNNGKLDGIHQIFYPDGNIEFEILYSNGKTVKESWFNTDTSKMNAQQIIEKGGLDPRSTHNQESGIRFNWAHAKLDARENIIINDIKFSRNPAEHYSTSLNMQDHRNLGHSYEEI